MIAAVIRSSFDRMTLGKRRFARFFDNNNWPFGQTFVANQARVARVQFKLKLKDIRCNKNKKIINCDAS